MKYDAGQLARLAREHCGAGDLTRAEPARPTTPVAADDTFPEPAEFVAVTIVRNVDPTSAAANRYDDPVDPVFAQLPPAESHRHHWVV